MDIEKNNSRQNFADELRGFALLGIVFVNAPFLGISAEGFTPTALQTGLDKLAAFAVVALAQAKFYLLFAFLFGYSLQFIIKDDADESKRRFKRRLFGLAVLGVLHAILFFIGDILLIYAILGMGLLLLRRYSDRKVLIISAIVLIAWLIIMGAIVWMSSMLLDTETGDASSLASQTFDAAMRTGNFWQASYARLQMWPWAALLILSLNGMPVFAMFGLGLIAGRQRVLAEPRQHASLWNAGLRWGAVLGLPLGLVSAWLFVYAAPDGSSSAFYQTMGVVLGFASAPLLSWAYVSALAKLHISGLKWLSVFRPAGRMSLSGYIGESFLLSIFFCAYGGGWFAQLGAASVVFCAFVTWVLLDLFAHFVQKRWAQGPLEFVLSKFSKC